MSLLKSNSAEVPTDECKGNEMTTASNKLRIYYELHGVTKKVAHLVFDTFSEVTWNLKAKTCSFTSYLELH